ncbi:hypothetical protein I3760_07G049800 [Carya illinoinensis]|nr:hypothetical protein I3760_07G049800 [Carya illinoinensis]
MSMPLTKLWSGLGTQKKIKERKRQELDVREETGEKKKRKKKRRSAGAEQEICYGTLGFWCFASSTKDTQSSMSWWFLHTRGPRFPFLLFGPIHARNSYKRERSTPPEGGFFSVKLVFL